MAATDAAGNSEVHPAAVAPWQVDMAAFVQITGGDAGAIISRRGRPGRLRIVRILRTQGISYGSERGSAPWRPLARAVVFI